MTASIQSKSACLRSVPYFMASHIRNDIHILPPRPDLNVARQFLRTILNRTRWRHRRCNHFDSLRGKRLLNSAPVLHARKVAAGKPKFIEAEKTVGEDNGVFWSICNAETVFSMLLSKNCNLFVGAHRSQLGLSSTGRE